jgi:hypothetical protein
MQKSKVSIQFTSLTKLWEFRMAIDINIFEMNLSQLTINCECTEEQITMAMEIYNGKLLKAKKEEEVF